MLIAVVGDDSLDATVDVVFEFEESLDSGEKEESGDTDLDDDEKSVRRLSARANNGRR